MAWGEYPAEYNAKDHGPYDPARYYGKPDTKWAPVKLGELVSWLARRNKSPVAMVQAVTTEFKLHTLRSPRCSWTPGPE
ncbi:unnamed protein product [Allacma fusca]|uniref:Uncharacterized protein n=1 Tax=Allacma fusca TaxID=39272 RepID=A0A8J2JYS4_9HEXA|nr:unnamed protein product [Allacma fusca]